MPEMPYEEYMPQPIVIIFDQDEAKFDQHHFVTKSGREFLVNGRVPNRDVYNSIIGGLRELVDKGYPGPIQVLVTPELAAELYALGVVKANQLLHGLYMDITLTVDNVFTVDDRQFPLVLIYYFFFDSRYGEYQDKKFVLVDDRMVPITV